MIDTIIQSPSIGNALRNALSLDAAGGMPLDCSTTVFPVCVVGDVRAQLTSNVRTFSGFRAVTGVAAQYSKVALRCPGRPTAGSLLYAVPRIIRLRDVAGAGVYWRLGTGTPPVAIDAAPRSLDSRSPLNGSCDVVGGANVTAITLSEMQGLFSGNTATSVEWRPPEMRLYPADAGDTYLMLYSDTVLTTLIVDMIWDEYYKS